MKTRKYDNMSWGCAGCLGIALVVLLLIALYLVIIGGIITLLWNWLLVELFGWPQISWIMGIGIAVLLGIVGGFFKGNNYSSK